MKTNEDFTIALERLRLLEQSMIMTMLQLVTIAPASATEGVLLCLNSAEQPSAWSRLYFTFTNGTAGADYTTTNSNRTVVLLREL
jgi:hypothetical protein